MRAPGLMRPVEILAKDKHGNWSVPPTGCEELRRHDHAGYSVRAFDGAVQAIIYIVSQVNPHLNFVPHLAEESHGRRQKRLEVISDAMLCKSYCVSLTFCC